MITIETTPSCKRTPLLYFALEEAQLAYTVEVRDDGYFARTYSTIGPLLRDGELVIWGLDAALRHVGRLRPALMPSTQAGHVALDCWIELHGSRLRPFLAQWARSGGTAKDAEEIIKQALGALERRLSEHAFLLDAFSIADCASVGLMALPMLRFDTSAFPAMSAYLGRLMQRAAFAQMQQRMQPTSAPAQQVHA
jgi:glutathione S-transferase